MTEPGYSVAPTGRGSQLAGTLVGNYRLLEEISTGGMGTVYKAQHELIGRPAAVKLLRTDLDARQEIIDRFFNEARAATAIRHPGIVEVFDFGYTDEGHGYLVMELLVGKTLKRGIADVGHYTEGEAAAIVRGIASALKAAHAQGIYHRDLKPDNVFLVPDLEGTTGAIRPKVLDFGIAKLSEDGTGHTKMGMLIGTPSYMAPEQAREASAVDHRADLYSLGCILYELLTGRPPFVTDSAGAGAIIAMHLLEDPMPPRDRAPHISPAMNTLVMRLLAKDPAQRLQQAGELVHALTPLLDGPRALEVAQVSTSRPTSPEPTTLREFSSPPAPRAARSRVPMIVGIALVVLVALGLAIAGVLASRSDPTPELPPVEPVRAVEPARQPVPAPRPLAAPERVVAPPETKAVTETQQIPGKPPVVVKVPAAPKPRKPRGPTTSEGSPVENDLGDDARHKVPGP